MSFRTSLLNYFIRRDRGWMLSLLTAVCLVYLPFLGNPFVFDDLPFFSGATSEVYAHAPLQFNLRWLSYASLGLTAAIFSDAVPHFFHLGNMLLHAANVILLFYLLRLLTGAVIGGDANPKVLVWGAWLGALAFACHPVAVYAVGYVIQRSILMATLFALLMQLAYLRGLLTGRKRWLALAAAAYFAACFSKEQSVMMPAVLAALAILLHDKNQASRTALWVTWSAFAATGIFVVLRAKGVFGTPYEAMAAALFEQQNIVESMPTLHLLSILTQAGLFFKYLGLWLLPNPAWMSVDMREPFVASIGEWRGWLGAVVFLAYGMMALRLLLRGGTKGLIGFALLYPWLQFMLEFSSIRVQEPFVLYRSYLWLPGMMLLIPILLTRLSGGKLLGYRSLAGLALLVLLLVPLSWNRLWVFADTYRLWNDAALLLRNDHVPGADRIFYNRGQASAAVKDWGKAIADLQRAVALSPGLTQLRYEMGMVYLNAGRYREAIGEFDIVISIRPDDGDSYYGKGLSLMGLHAGKEALPLMNKACELKHQLACLMAGWSKFKK
ncbi:MAG TPA: tetratricopeptide repeat protein [Gallionella sp.]|nr:tetratricopeptide repeat protein [Gallionella sp.]